MKTAFLTFLYFCFVVVMGAVESNGQSEEHPPGTAITTPCIKVSISADSVTFVPNRPINMVTKVFSDCPFDVFVLEPYFSIEKALLGEAKRRGDRFSARIFAEDSDEPNNTKRRLKAGESIEYRTSTSELRWKDMMSSIDVFRDIFADPRVEPGLYVLYAVTVAEGGKWWTRKAVHFSSNRIDLIIQ